MKAHMNEEMAIRNSIVAARQKRSTNENNDEHSASKWAQLLNTHDHSDVLIFFYSLHSNS